MTYVNLNYGNIANYQLALLLSVFLVGCAVFDLGVARFCHQNKGQAKSDKGGDSLAKFGHPIILAFLATLKKKSIFFAFFLLK